MCVEHYSFGCRPLESNTRVRVTFVIFLAPPSVHPVCPSGILGVDLYVWNDVVNLRVLPLPCPYVPSKSIVIHPGLDEQ